MTSSPPPPLPVPTTPSPLLNKTFTTHRLSPLYTPSSTTPLLTSATLTAHARALHDILRGTVLRGVRVGLDASSSTASTDNRDLERAGALVRVSWTLFASSRGEAGGGDDDDGEGGGDGDGDGQGVTGIHISIIYESAEYTAFLLRSSPTNDDENDKNDPNFTALPLFLTRMPRSLTSTLTSYLATHFDTRVGALALPSAFLLTRLEAALRPPLSALAAPLRDVLVQFRFAAAAAAAPACRTVDVTIPREDVARFAARGKALGRGGDRDRAEVGTAPFTLALAEYLATHLALDMRHKEVGVGKVACGEWVLGGEGRVKLLNGGGVASVLRALVERAGEGLEGVGLGE
ncbi:MAG: hypothetical protein M1833_000211 [Piccolia ochrophora]|nr:MAG: hypothetical protein M1833_000211 [Piccolia ochrophora]